MGYQLDIFRSGTTIVSHLGFFRSVHSIWFDFYAKLPERANTRNLIMFGIIPDSIYLLRVRIE